MVLSFGKYIPRYTHVVCSQYFRISIIEHGCYSHPVSFSVKKSSLSYSNCSYTKLDQTRLDITIYEIAQHLMHL